MNPVIIQSILSLSSIAAVAAIILFVIAKQFYVYEDHRIHEVEDLLPGANCGGCGYPGCHGFAEAIVKAADAGDISSFSCPAASSETTIEISNFLGLAVSSKESSIAVIRCNGSCENAPARINYDGPDNCDIAHTLFCRENMCPNGCLGKGSCVNVCSFDAMTIDPVTGLPVIDPEKCTGCGACVEECPRDLIEIRSRGKRDRRVWVACVNTEKGVIAKKQCYVACIGCGRCVKECPDKIQAITIQNNLAYIDPEKCTACGKCVVVCPTKAILASFPIKQPKKVDASLESGE